MKKSYLVFTALLAMLYITLSSDVDGPAHHGHGNVTGAPSGVVGRCEDGSCHGGNNASNIVALQVLDSSTMLPVTTYGAGQTYLVKLTGDATAISTSLPGFGFQASVVLGNHTQGGTFTVPAASASQMHTYPCGPTTVIEHSVMMAPVTAGINKYATQFYWTAPATFSDSVTFYALLNAVNGDGGDGGDNPDAAPMVTLHENPADKVAQVISFANDLTVFPNPTSGNPTVSYNLTSDQNVTIYVLDITGKKVAQITENEPQQSGAHQYQVAISTPGLYFITLSTANFSYTLRFIKQ